MKRLVCLCGSLILASNVTAATISFTSPAWLVSNDLVVDGGATFGTVQKDGAFVLPKFDPSLGALTDVTFNLTSVLYAAQEFTLVGFGSPIESTANSAYTLSIADLITGPLLQETFHNFEQCMQGGGLCIVKNQNNGGAMFNDSVSVAPLAGYQGVGNFDLTFSHTTEININIISGRAEAGLVAGWSGDLEVVYTYNVIPLPAAVWLFGSGLGLLGWMKRKRA